jgi:hypothetical protein
MDSLEASPDTATADLFNFDLPRDQGAFEVSR